MPLKFVPVFTATMLVAGMVSTPATAAVDTLAIWNQIEGSYGVYPVPRGFATPPTDDASITPLGHVGYTRHATYPTKLVYQNVPESIDLDHYLHFTITPKTGLQFESAYFRVAGIASLSPAMDYEIRTSQDNYQTVYDGAFWNNTTARNGNTYRDLEIDLTDMPVFDSATTFRLYFKDNDNFITSVSSTATWPYGWQLYGETSEVPEPTSLVLALGGGLLLMQRRRRSLL